MKVELIENGVRINNIDYHIGDKIEAKVGSETIDQGEVAFGIYLNSGTDYDEWHIGFVVKRENYPSSYLKSRKTLLDFLMDAEQAGAIIKFNRR